MKYSIFLLCLFISFYSKSQVSQFVKDPKTKCLIWDNNYNDKDTITWTGKCKNNFADGKGILIKRFNHKVVTKYVGRMQNGKYHGKGQLDEYNRASMKGHFENGKLNGFGKVNFVDGTKFKGNFKKGALFELDRPYFKYLKKENVKIKDTSNIYVYDGDSDTLFYYALVPKHKIEGVLVLLPSMWESAENVVSSNKKLMQLAYDNNILSVVLSANYNLGFEQDSLSMEFFNTTFKEITDKFQCPIDKFILCGLSLGGNNALLYTEMSRNNEYFTSIKPLAVIGIDPQVDLVTQYNNAKDEIEMYTKDSLNLNVSKRAALDENIFLLKCFKYLYGGTPQEFPEKYIKGSQFSLNQKDGGNAKYLIDVPVRLYSDPDIIWLLKNKNRDYYHINAANLSAMIKYLTLNGNEKAEFVSAIGKGFRLEGLRHPHSWSIVEPIDCIKWIKDLIK